MKKIFLIILLVSAVASSAKTNVCADFCDEGFWATATPETILEIIEAGADINATDGLGGTPLHWAAISANAENITALLDAGAAINATDENEWTPLELAIFFGSSESVITLSLAGAEINTNTLLGWTPLHLAALLGTPESIDALLSIGADGSVKNADGETPFDMAQYNEYVFETAAYWALDDAQDNSTSVASVPSE